MPNIKTLKVDELGKHFHKLLTTSYKKNGHTTAINIGNLVYRALLCIASIPEKNDRFYWRSVHMEATIQVVDNMGWLLTVHDILNSKIVLQIIIAYEGLPTYRDEASYSKKCLDAVNLILRTLDDFELKRRESWFLEGKNETRRQIAEDYANNILGKETEDLLKETGARIVPRIEIKEDDTIINIMLYRGASVLDRSFLLSVKNREYSEINSEGNSKRYRADIDEFKSKVNVAIQTRLALMD